MIISIERTLVLSQLESDYINQDSKIKTFLLNDTFFKDTFLTKIVKAINRLKELDIPFDAEILRAKFINSNAWNMDDERQYVQLLEHNAVSTFKLFNSYYDVLKDNTNEIKARDI